MPEEHNVFIALAHGMWARGEDGEVIARELALAFKKIVEEGNDDVSVEKEFTRFISE